VTVPTVLAGIVEAVRKDLDERKGRTPLAELERRAAARGPGLPFPVRRGGAGGVVAEVKRASPSKGWIREGLSVEAAVRGYREGGASAVSVLTERSRFGGSLADLEEAREAAGGTALLRKDFVLDRYMVAEARAHGADLVLLMVSVLGEETAPMVRAAREYGLTPLVEVHDGEELATALAAGAELVGINNRNLKTLEVDLATSERLLPSVPAGVRAVVESGIRGSAEIRRFRALGADAFLVGEALVSAADPVALLAELVEAARTAAGPRKKE
jgi:indole-3-glycerol phosphate synthase